MSGATVPAAPTCVPPVFARTAPDGSRVTHDASTVYDPLHDARFEIPAGWRYDGASVPRVVRSLLDNDDLGTDGPCVHDWLYAHLGHVGDETARHRRPYTRAECDRLFDAFMRRDGVTPWKRRAAYAAVRVGGWVAWRNHQRNPITDGARVQAALAAPQEVP